MTIIDPELVPDGKAVALIQLTQLGAGGLIRGEFIYPIQDQDIFFQLLKT